MGPVEKCTKDSVIDKKGVHEVVLVGGSTRMRYNRWAEDNAPIHAKVRQGADEKYIQDFGTVPNAMTTKSEMHYGEFIYSDGTEHLQGVVIGMCWLTT